MFFSVVLFETIRCGKDGPGQGWPVGEGLPRGKFEDLVAAHATREHASVVFENMFNAVHMKNWEIFRESLVIPPTVKERVKCGRNFGDLGA